MKKMMNIDYSSLLEMSHGGITIYQAILNNLYNGQFKIPAINDYWTLTENPFDNYKHSLALRIDNGIAVHKDLSHNIPAGDCFLFAKMVFTISNQELLDELGKIVESFTAVNFPNHPVPPANRNKSIPEFSLFRKPITNLIPDRVIDLFTLYRVIKNTEFKYITELLRSIKDPKEARRYKAENFPYVTFAGTFRKRNDKELIKPSGLMVIDFDHIENIENLKSSLIKDPMHSTELLFKSPSGNGLKWVIKVDLELAPYSEYYEAVAIYISETYKVDIDPTGKNVSRACFIPHDPEVFINPAYLEEDYEENHF